MLRLTDENIIRAEILEDHTGEWGLYIVLDTTDEICLTEGELRALLAEIEASR